VTDEVSVTVHAPPERVYALVSDIRRMGEWSPECYRCEWVDGADAATVGARFRGHNRRYLLRWSNTPEVIAAEPGREFAFRRVAPGAGEVIWRYTLVPQGTDTVLTESYRVVRPSGVPVRVMLFLLARVRDRRAELRADMTQTLNRLKAAAEARALSHGA
jgi:uncharacterized protein YndB with AHSA1/START domain